MNKLEGKYKWFFQGKVYYTDRELVTYINPQGERIMIRSQEELDKLGVGMSTMTDKLDENEEEK